MTTTPALINVSLGGREGKDYLSPRSALARFYAFLAAPYNVTAGNTTMDRETDRIVVTQKGLDALKTAADAPLPPDEIGGAVCSCGDKATFSSYDAMDAWLQLHEFCAIQVVTDA